MEFRHSLGRRLSDPVVDILRHTGITPNTLTVLGFVVSLAAASVIALDELLIGGLLVLFSGSFDLLDGPLARATNQSTRFGAFLDSTLDRLSEAVLLFGLLMLYYLNDSEAVEVWLIYITLAGSMMVSYMRARAEGLGIKCETGLFTRPERLIIIAIGLLVNQVFIALCILAVLAWVTVLQRFIYVRRQTRE